MVDDKLTLAKAQNEVARLKALLSHAMKQLAERDGGTGGGGAGRLCTLPVFVTFSCVYSVIQCQ